MLRRKEDHPHGCSRKWLVTLCIQGFCLFQRESRDIKINVLRDTGATQSLILNNILPFSDKPSIVVGVLLHGVEMGVIKVPDRPSF